MQKNEKNEKIEKKEKNEKPKGNLTIYQKYMDLIYYSNDLVRKFPKSERFALVNEIKNTLYGGLHVLIFAVKTFNITEKLSYLKKLDVYLYLLKIHIRLAFRYKYISVQNYTTWSTQINDICNMLGGWINSCQKR